MSEATPHETWSSGTAYESYVGRWSRLVAREFLTWLAAPPGARWLDVGCGTGALCQTILALADPASVTGVDASDGYIAYARERTPDSRATFIVGDAQALPVANDGFDVVVSGLMLNFVPEPKRAVAEMARAVRPGGTIAVYVWDYSGNMEFMRRFWDMAIAVDPAALALDEGRRFLICQPEPLAAVFRDACPHAVETRAIDIPTDFRDFDDYWTPFLGGQGSAPSYAMSLSEERRNTLRERLRASLPITADGSIHLTARVWAVRATC